MNVSQNYVALLREGQLASQLLATGITNLRKTDSARPGLFSAALFELSIGFERVGKMTVIVDHCILHNGSFPSDADLRKLHHDITSLFDAVKEIATRRSDADARYPVPNDPIHLEVIQVLSDFAKLTRYHNLDLIVQGRAASMLNPEEAWFDVLGNKILSKHYTLRQTSADDDFAAGINDAFGENSVVIRLGSNGKFITNLMDDVKQAQRRKHVLKHSQFYTLQLIRFFTQTLWDAQSAAHAAGIEDVPHLSELFGAFYNDDSYFKKRKTWGG